MDALGWLSRFPGRHLHQSFPDRDHGPLSAGRDVERGADIPRLEPARLDHERPTVARRDDEEGFALAQAQPALVPRVGDVESGLGPERYLAAILERERAQLGRASDVVRLKAPQRIRSPADPQDQCDARGQAAGEDTTIAQPRRREIRSFVRREGRMTPAQKRALEELWPKFGVEPPDGRVERSSRPTAASSRRACSGAMHRW